MLEQLRNVKVYLCSQLLLKLLTELLHVARFRDA